MAPARNALTTSVLLTALALAAPSAETAEDKTDVLDGISIDEAELRDGSFRQVLDDERTATFTLHPKLQRYAERLFNTYEVPVGAAVMLNSRTGRVHALAQRRTDPAMAGDGHVALDSSPPAASVFKIISAAALLDQGEVSPDTKTCYHGGSSRLLQQHIEDSPQNDTACASLATALGRSINPIFAKLTDRHLTRNTLADHAERFGFNRRLPFDVVVPLSKAEIPEDRLELARTAAGFWHTHLSPLHAAAIAQALAQRGSMLRPYIVESVTNSDGQTLHQAKPEFIGRIATEEIAGKLIAAMELTVSRGTARKAFHDNNGRPLLPGIRVAGKTGTLTGRKPYRAYSWFVATAPADRPEVALAVLVVNKPKWRIKSTAVAARLLREYFQLKEKGEL